MPKSTKGKCVFTEKLQKNYPFIRATDNSEKVLCTICNCEISLTSGGKADIERHIGRGKHTTAAKSQSSTQSVASIFTSDLAKPAKEGVWTYHTVRANQSFRSASCATQIFRSCFGMSSFRCSKTKCQAIVTNVFAPHARGLLKEDLKQCRYLSVYTDASNHGNVKIFPVLVRYFKPLTGVQVKVLHVSSQHGETSAIISNLISTAATEYDIKTKIVGFCGDNAKVNFGGSTRGGQNNVYYHLKAWIPHLIGIGCTAHIVHNSLKSACEAVPFDVECVVVKIYSHFYLYCVRTRALQEMCESANTEYKKLLGYAKTRFLALGPAIKRILHLYDALQDYFISLPKGEKLLKEFFQKPDSKFWLMFVEEQVTKSTYSIHSTQPKIQTHNFDVSGSAVCRLRIKNRGRRRYGT